jgi:sugar phosphate isomerase/epimerase
MFSSHWQELFNFNPKINPLMNRRNFLQTSAGLSALSLLSFKALSAPDSHAVGLQLYTLRDDIQSQGIEKVLAQVAKLGFKEVENFGYGNGKFFDKTPQEYSKILKDNGLKAVSGHYLTGRSKQVPVANGLTKNWQKAVEDGATIGQKYAILAYLFDDERTSDDYKALIDDLNKGAETAKKSGLILGYHNHDFEFTQKIDGKKPFDLILEQTKLPIEMDLYWVSKAGEKATQYFAKYPGRFPLWHVKDMANTAEKEFTEVGNGVINFKEIFAQAKKAGMKHYFVEQDKCNKPPFESIKISIDYIKQQKLGA